MSLSYDVYILRPENFDINLKVFSNIFWTGRFALLYQESAYES